MWQAAQLVDGIWEPAVAISRDGRVVALNNAAADLLGGPADTVLGRRCGDVICALGRDGQRVCSVDDCAVLRSIAAGKAVELQWSGWLGADGRTRQITATAIVIPRNTNDEAAGVLVLHVGPPLESGDLVDSRLHLLGTVELRGPAGPVVPRRQRTRELLALLALAGDQGVRREELIDLLWPEDVIGDDTATYLRVLIHDLRATLATLGVRGTPHRSGDRYVLRSGAIQVDAVEFETHAEALLRNRHARAGSFTAIEAVLAIYGGDLAAAEDFGTWVLPLRARLRSLYLDLLWAAVKSATAASDFERVVAYSMRALLADPLQERFQAAVIGGYRRLGRFTDARRQYGVYRKLLGRELTAPPSPAFERAIIEGLAVAG